MLNEKRVELHRKIVSLLSALTKKGNAAWFRRQADPEYVFCQCERDLLVFELSDGTGENSKPLENTHGITLNIRNVSITWFEGLDEDWDQLISLVRSAELDESKLPACKMLVLESIVQDLNAY